MRPETTEIFQRLVDQARTVKPPADIDGNSTPHHAWLSGYLAALGAALTAFQRAEGQEAGAREQAS